MNRRDFIKTMITMIAGSFVIPLIDKVLLDTRQDLIDADEGSRMVDDFSDMISGIVNIEIDADEGMTIATNTNGTIYVSDSLVSNGSNITWQCSWYEPES